MIAVVHLRRELMSHALRWWDDHFKLSCVTIVNIELGNFSDVHTRLCEIQMIGRRIDGNLLNSNR